MLYIQSPLPTDFLIAELPAPSVFSIQSNGCGDRIPVPLFYDQKTTRLLAAFPITFQFDAYSLTNVWEVNSILGGWWQHDLHSHNQFQSPQGRSFGPRSPSVGHRVGTSVNRTGGRVVMGVLRIFIRALQETKDSHLPAQTVT